MDFTETLLSLSVSLSLSVCLSLSLSLCLSLCLSSPGLLLPSVFLPALNELLIRGSLGLGHGSINRFFGGSGGVSSDRDTAVTFTNWDTVRLTAQCRLGTSQVLLLLDVSSIILVKTSI